MAWSTTRTTSKSIVPRHYLRGILLVASAWIVVYNFQHYDSAKSDLPDEGPGRSRRQPHRYPNADIIAAGPQIGDQKVVVSMTDDVVIVVDKEQSPLQTSEHKPAAKHLEAPSVAASSASPAATSKSAIARLETPAIKSESAAASSSAPASKAEPASSKWIQNTSTDPSDPAIKHLTLSRRTPHSKSPTLLALIMTRDASSWGTNEGPARSFASYLSMLRSSGLDLTTVAVGLLTASESEFSLYEALIEQDEEQFGAATIILHPGYMDPPRPKSATKDGDDLNSDAGSGDATDDKADPNSYRLTRHDNQVQHDRRVEMARLRNYLMFNTLTLAPSLAHILWVDADIYEFSPNLIPNMLSAMARDTSSVGLITAISHFGPGQNDYDLNSFRGKRTKPNEQEREKMRDEVGSWVAFPDGAHFVHHLIEKEKNMQGRREKLKAGEGAFDPLKAEFEERGLESAQPGSEEGEVKRLEKRPEPPSSAEGNPLEKRTDDLTNPWWEEDEPPEVEGLLRLDAVGATVLLMRTDLVRQGLAFSTSYLVGTDWIGEGWDAIESEGLCITARTLGGAGCWAMIEGHSRHCQN